MALTLFAAATLAVCSFQEPVALGPAVWTTVGARVPSLELFDARGTGAADLAAVVRTVDAEVGGPAKRTLLIRFASW